jgi:hypothetical protein
MKVQSLSLYGGAATRSLRMLANIDARWSVAITLLRVAPKIEGKEGCYLSMQVSQVQER